LKFKKKKKVDVVIIFSYKTTPKIEIRNKTETQWTPQMNRIISCGVKWEGGDIIKAQIPQHDTEIYMFSKESLACTLEELRVQIGLPMTSCTVSTGNQPRHTHQSVVSARHKPM